MCLHPLGEINAQHAASLHDAQAEGDDLRGEQELDDLLVVRLDEGPDDAERREPEVLERSRLGHRVEERVQEQGDVRVQERGQGLGHMTTFLSHPQQEDPQTKNPFCCAT